MAKSAGGVRGGRYSSQIADARRFYQRERESAYRAYDEQLREAQRRGFTEREYDAMARHISYFQRNPTRGTVRDLNNYISDNLKKVQSGEYNERLMNMSSGLGGEVVRSMAQSAAQRDMLERYRELLRRNRR